MTVEIEVVEDPARACGAMLVGASLGGGHVVLTGGSTPRAAYGELVAAVKSVGLDLSDTTYWLGDERCVPPDDERANSRMIKESLIDPLIGVTEPTFKRIKAELGPDEGADAYEREHVTPFLSRRPERFPAATLECERDLGRERWTVDHPTRRSAYAGLLSSA